MLCEERDDCERSAFRDRTNCDGWSDGNLYQSLLQENSSSSRTCEIKCESLIGRWDVGEAWGWAKLTLAVKAGIRIGKPDIFSAGYDSQ